MSGRLLSGESFNQAAGSIRDNPVVARLALERLESASKADRRSRFRRRLQPAACTGALLGCLASLPFTCHAASSASGATADSQDASYVTVTGLLASNTITTKALQQVSRQDSSAKAAKSSPGVLPATIETSRARWNNDTTSGVAVDSVAYRVAYGTATSAVSVGVGASGYRVQPGGTALTGGVGANAAAGASTGATLPSLSVGYRHNFTDKYSLNMEATRASGINSQLRDSLTATRVNVEYKPARNSAIGLEQGSVSLKMSSSGNFAMKIKRGGPMFYMRSKF